jgi:hypothetical protein
MGKVGIVARARRWGCRYAVRMEIDKAFRGNKRSLASKPCIQCGRPMSWRKAWAKNWAEVKYCSERCRAAAKQDAA